MVLVPYSLVQDFSAPQFTVCGSSTGRDARASGTGWDAYPPVAGLDLDNERIQKADIRQQGVELKGILCQVLFQDGQGLRFR